MLLFLNLVEYFFCRTVNVWPMNIFKFYSIYSFIQSQNKQIFIYIYSYLFLKTKRLDKLFTIFFDWPLTWLSWNTWSLADYQAGDQEEGPQLHGHTLARREQEGRGPCQGLGQWTVGSRGCESLLPPTTHFNSGISERLCCLPIDLKICLYKEIVDSEF